MTADYVNLITFETPQRLLLVDTGMEDAGEAVFKEIRRRTDARILERWCLDPSDLPAGETRGML
jgi:hypothetical protein